MLDENLAGLNHLKRISNELSALSVLNVNYGDTLNAQYIDIGE